MKPEAIVEMHPETAKTMGLREGEMVYIETNKGRIRQRLAYDDELDPHVVVTSFGWWFPEDRTGVCGWDRSNINVLTRSEPPYDPGIGTVDLRGIPCKVYSVGTST